MGYAAVQNMKRITKALPSCLLLDAYKNAMSSLENMAFFSGLGSDALCITPQNDESMREARDYVWDDNCRSVRRDWLA